MNFADYQRLAQETDKTDLASPAEARLVPLLGLAGEAGQLLSEYKKWLRDGPSHVRFVDRVEEELGDILWYVANAASKYGLRLDRIAASNLEKTRSRFLPDAVPADLDADFAESERLPPKFTLELTEQRDDERVVVRTTINGILIGAELTDNSFEDDGYRFHDVFHASYAAILGWSPVLRKLLKRKRKSSALVDEVEDGGRAAVIEEGIAAVVFDYARNHNFLEGVRGIDDNLLKTIRGMSSHLEVASQPDTLWQRAILEGFEVWREVLKNGGGRVEVDLAGRSLCYAGARDTATATAAAVASV